MLYSGEVVDLKDIPGIKVDKHSTGGVGDKLSLIIAPLVAAAGVPVPMISGRGLGHSGGTLDKLESIPGFNVNFSIAEYRKIISEINLCLIGQTGEIAPADKKIYALRDVTATVQSIPLITASIMSKKLAEGIDALVLDVKSGRGAFMENEERALKLAENLVGVGELFGKSTIGLMTDMNIPLGYAVGNWLEVRESIDALRGRGPDDVMEISLALAGTMIHLGKKADTIEEGIKVAEDMLSSGKGMEKFAEIVERQEGDVSVLEHPEKYPPAKTILEIKAEKDGYIEDIDALEIGLCSVETGAGRLKAEDPVDPSAGILLKRHYGDLVKRGEVIAELHTNRDNNLENLEKRIAAAFRFSGEKPAERSLIKKKISKNGIEEWK
jgi:pyrimidine-nucleoside phosphorylase